MKVTETIQTENGVETRQINIPFSQGRSQVCYTLVPDTDEPIAVKITEAGWHDNGPTFHVITEYGDHMVSDYDYLNLVQLFEKWPEFKSIWEKFQSEVIVSAEDFAKYSNDMELGKFARSQNSNNREYRMSNL
jgi:hypothetical protein